MPVVARMPPGRRCFARIDRFECECPHCGRLIFAGIDKRYLPKRLTGGTSDTRAAAKQRPRTESTLKLFWNPYTQRFCCPFCDHVYTVGLVFYPVGQRTRRIVVPPGDCEPTPAEVAEMRRLAGGWWVKGGKGADRRRPEDYANLVVDGECSCPELGTAPACPLHGEDALAAGAVVPAVPEPEPLPEAMPPGPPPGPPEGGESARDLRLLRSPPYLGDPAHPPVLCPEVGEVPEEQGVTNGHTPCPEGVQKA